MFIIKYLPKRWLLVPSIGISGWKIESGCISWKAHNIYNPWPYLIKAFLVKYQKIIYLNIQKLLQFWISSVLQRTHTLPQNLLQSINMALHKAGAWNYMMAPSFHILHNPAPDPLAWPGQVMCRHTSVVQLSL